MGSSGGVRLVYYVEGEAKEEIKRNCNLKRQQQQQRSTTKLANDTRRASRGVPHPGKEESELATLSLSSILFTIAHHKASTAIMFANLVRQSIAISGHVRGCVRGQPRPALRSLLPSSSMAIHTSVSSRASWGGGKLKTHSGAAKRFMPVGKRRVVDNRSVSRYGLTLKSPAQLITDVNGDLVRLASPTRQIGVMFKRGQAGKQHLNSKMDPSRRMRLRSVKLHRSGPSVKVLSRLLGYRKRR